VRLVRAGSAQKALPVACPATTIVKGINKTRGDLQQLAATLNNPLKRWPGAYARAFLLPLSLEREHQ